MPFITVDEVATTLRTAMLGTTPRIVEGQVGREWKHAEGDVPPRASARWFRFVWTGEGDMPGGMIGPGYAETRVTLSIMVDYGGVPRHRVEVLAEDDLLQLRDVFNRLKSSTSGLRFVQQVGWSYVVPTTAAQDPNQARVALQYDVRYMKARG